MQDPAPPNESTKISMLRKLTIQIGAHPPNCRSAIERHRCLSCCHIWPSSPQRNRRGDARALSCVEKARKVGWSGAGKGLVSVRLSAGRKWTRELGLPLGPDQRGIVVRSRLPVLFAYHLIRDILALFSFLYLKNKISKIYGE